MRSWPAGRDSLSPRRTDVLVQRRRTSGRNTRSASTDVTRRESEPTTGPNVALPQATRSKRRTLTAPAVEPAFGSTEPRQAIAPGSSAGAGLGRRSTVPRRQRVGWHSLSGARLRCRGDRDLVAARGFRGVSPPPSSGVPAQGFDPVAFRLKRDTQRDPVYLPREAHFHENELPEWATPGPSEPACLLGSTTKRAQQLVFRASLSFAFRP